MVLSEGVLEQAQRVAAMRKAGVHVVPCAPPKLFLADRSVQPPLMTDGSVLSLAIILSSTPDVGWIAQTPTAVSSTPPSLRGARTMR